MASFAFRSVLFALLFAVTRCSQRYTHVGFNFNHKAGTVLYPFAVSAKSDDVKRPFGGGRIFSRPRTSDNRWGGERSLIPWAMSKSILKQHDAKRYHPRPPNDEDMNYGVMKRPFGPGIYTRPSASREEKRPFGGNMIFSKPRVAWAKPRFGGYPISRERREDSWGTAGMQPREISDHRKEKSHSSISQKGWEEKERDAWLDALERGGEGRKNHRQMSLASYNHDYKDGEFDGIFRKEQVDDDNEEEEEVGKEEHSGQHRPRPKEV